jgi:Flp pilus assembly protein TadD
MRRDAKRFAALAAVGILLVAVLAGGGRAQPGSPNAAASDSAAKAETQTKIAPAQEAPAQKAPAQEAPAQKAPAPRPVAAPHGKSLGAAADTVRLMEIAVEKDTANFDKNYRLGVAYLDRDRSIDAIDTFRRCTRLRPTETKAWVNLGAAQDALGKGPEARISYRKALTLNADDEIALCRLGASHYASGQGPDRAAAMDTLRLALAKHPRSYCAYFQLGVAFADAQIYKEAIAAWNKVVEYGPGTPEALSAQESISVLHEQLLTP